MKVSKAAMEWSRAVFEHRPVTVFFTRVPLSCARTRCGGFHDTVSVSVAREGRVTKQWEYGFHAKAVDAPIVPCGEGVLALAEEAQRLMRWARRVDPWARYPSYGLRQVNEEGEQQEIWFE
jgi:hypothetical protein